MYEKMTTYTNVKKEDLEKLKFPKEKTKSQYELLRLRKNDVVLILFSSNKLLLQGKEEKVKEIEKMIDENKIGKKVIPIKYIKTKGTVIGSDEALKGDSFGGIVVAAVKADEKIRQDLLFAGVMDSKKLKDEEIPIIAERIKKVAKHEIFSLTPEEYNKFSGVTEILNDLHQMAISRLGDANKKVVDQYPGCNVKATKTTKAEQKYVEVAAASILARDEALKQLQQLSKKIGFQLPKGSTHVKEALQKVKPKDLVKYAKLHFSNVKKFL